MNALLTLDGNAKTEAMTATSKLYANTTLEHAPNTQLENGMKTAGFIMIVLRKNATQEVTAGSAMETAIPELTAGAS